jgi:hypothetical protein
MSPVYIHLAPSLRLDTDAIRDRVTEPLTHGIFIHGIRSQVAVLGIPLQPVLPFQVTADLDSDGMRQLCEFLTGRRPDPPEPSCPIGTVDVHDIEEQHEEALVFAYFSIRKEIFTKLMKSG